MKAFILASIISLVSALSTTHSLNSLENDKKEVVHDFHFSKLLININDKTNLIEFTLHTFIDDLELAIAEESKTTTKIISDSIRLVTPKEYEKADKLITAYLNQCFSLKGASYTYPVEFVGKEKGDDPYSIYLYFMTPLSKKGDQLKVMYDMYTEFYDDQQNMVVWQINGKTIQSDLLTQSEKISKLKL